MEVVSLIKYKLLKELEEILEPTHLTRADAATILEELYQGKTLATALRTVNLRSPYEIPERVWVRLRPWRNKHFPLVAISPIEDQT